MSPNMVLDLMPLFIFRNEIICVDTDLFSHHLRRGKRLYKKWRVFLDVICNQKVSAQIFRINSRHY